MTERLYYTDCYCREFRGHVVERSADRVYLDRTAFYPTSGGQLCDTGTIGGAAVVEVIDEGERIAHLVIAPVEADEVACSIDWPRRFDHMQQHSGQHLLSSVFVERFGFETVGVHLGSESSTIDLDTAALAPDQVAAAEWRANELVQENRSVTITFAETAEELGLRKASSREGTLRIVEIEGLDRSACGGTHVRATGEIGPIAIRKLDRVRNTVRIEFLCGGRAVRRARADFELLARIAQTFSSPLDDAAELVRAQGEALRGADKQRQKLEAELAGYQGHELYDATPPDATGVRRLRRHVTGSVDTLRALAQSFCSRPKAVFVGVVDDPPAVLLAVSEDSGLDAGKTLKAALAVAGGRGGGSPRMAQGSLPSREALSKLLESL